MAQKSKTSFAFPIILTGIPLAQMQYRRSDAHLVFHDDPGLIATQHPSSGRASQGNPLHF
jgi:hypothetical protein